MKSKTILPAVAAMPPLTVPCMVRCASDAVLLVTAFSLNGVTPIDPHRIRLDHVGLQVSGVIVHGNGAWKLGEVVDRQDASNWKRYLHRVELDGGVE